MLLFPASKRCWLHQHFLASLSPVLPMFSRVTAIWSSLCQMHFRSYIALLIVLYHIRGVPVGRRPPPDALGRAPAGLPRQARLLQPCCRPWPLLHRRLDPFARPHQPHPQKPRGLCYAACFPRRYCFCIQMRGLGCRQCQRTGRQPHAEQSSERCVRRALRSATAARRGKRGAGRPVAELTHVIHHISGVQKGSKPCDSKQLLRGSVEHSHSTTTGTSMYSQHISQLSFGAVSPVLNFQSWVVPHRDFCNNPWRPLQVPVTLRYHFLPDSGVAAQGR